MRGEELRSREGMGRGSEVSQLDDATAVKKADGKRNYSLRTKLKPFPPELKICLRPFYARVLYRISYMYRLVLNPCS